MDGGMHVSVCMCLFLSLFPRLFSKSYYVMMWSASTELAHFNAMQQRRAKQTETVSCKQAAMSMSNRQSQNANSLKINILPKSACACFFPYASTITIRLPVFLRLLPLLLFAGCKTVTIETASNGKNVILAGNIAISSFISLNVFTSLMLQMIHETNLNR